MKKKTHIATKVYLLQSVGNDSWQYVMLAMLTDRREEREGLWQEETTYIWYGP
jgi:hypothetical protein